MNLLTSIGKRLRRRPILHPIGTEGRTSLYNMVILLFVTVAAIVIAVLIIRNRDSSGSFTSSEVVRGDSPAAGECAKQSAVADSQMKQLIVVLPDGTVVTPRLAGLV